MVRRHLPKNPNRNIFQIFLPNCWLCDLESMGIEEAWASLFMFTSSMETTRRMVGYCSMTMLDAELTGVSASVGMGILFGVRKLSVAGGVGDLFLVEAGNMQVPEETD